MQNAPHLKCNEYVDDVEVEDTLNPHERIIIVVITITAKNTDYVMTNLRNTENAIKTMPHGGNLTPNKQRIDGACKYTCILTQVKQCRGRRSRIT